MKRFWEIDFLRGIAIILMIIFNWSYTLKYFNLYTIQSGWTYWYLFPRFIGGMFIFLVGLSLILSYNRVKHKSIKEIYLKYLKRGLKIFGLGLGITFITWILFPSTFIIFGILHLIGFSIILAIPFLNFKKLNLILGLLLIGSGIYLQNTIKIPLLLWLIPQSFPTFDYFPILPWFGIVLIGLFAGNTLYRKNKRTFNINDYSETSIIKHISYLGKYSLILYLIHQPILVALLFILGFL
ncbi:MAG: DUF1624 domain-containing protein [Nanoarchaeota archaeon]|nr:DUF1624 domain-containing protein [Nanoarchaeota archaeon]